MDRPGRRQIEGILHHDPKVATYKLNLFRALAKIATQELRVATWLLRGQVSVPITRIAERWLGYYWPLFASERFIHQSQSEGKGQAQPVTFQAAMSALMGPSLHRAGTELCVLGYRITVVRSCAGSPLLAAARCLRV